MYKFFNHYPVNLMQMKKLWVLQLLLWTLGCLRAKKLKDTQHETFD